MTENNELRDWYQRADKITKAKKPIEIASEHPKIVRAYMEDKPQVLKELKELSLKYGGAWVYDVLPFSHDTKFVQYVSPSKVPDSWYGISHNQIGYKGKIVPFTEAAQYREQKRGYSADR